MIFFLNRTANRLRLQLTVYVIGGPLYQYILWSLYVSPCKYEIVSQILEYFMSRRKFTLRDPPYWIITRNCSGNLKLNEEL